MKPEMARSARILAIAIAVAAVIWSVVRYLTPLQTGRYVLVPASIDNISADRNIVGTLHRIFKIDTVTGETWYIERSVEFGFIAVEGWAKVNDDYLQAITNAALTFKKLKQ